MSLDQSWDGSPTKWAATDDAAARLPIHQGGVGGGDWLGHFRVSCCCTWQSHATLVTALTTCPTMPSCIRADYPCSGVTASVGLFLIKLL